MEHNPFMSLADDTFGEAKDGTDRDRLYDELDFDEER